MSQIKHGPAINDKCANNQKLNAPVQGQSVGAAAFREEREMIYHELCNVSMCA